MIAWHYTVGEATKVILESGLLLTENETTPEYLFPSTKGGLWFSLNQTYEPTAAKMQKRADTGELIMSPDVDAMGDMLSRGFQLWRFGVDDGRLLTWPEYLGQSGLRHKMLFARGRRYVEEMLRSAKRRGANPDDWRVSLAPLRLEEISEVQVWSGGQWTGVHISRTSEAA